MKPESYLTADAKKYFKGIASILEGRGMGDESFSLELSILSQEYAIYQQAIESYSKEKKFTNKHDQVAAFMTIKDKAMSNILKLSPKFGLTPFDLNKLKSLVKEEIPDELNEL